MSADLDREERATFAVIVTASDHATPPLNTSTQFEVILDDSELTTGISDGGSQFDTFKYVLFAYEEAWRMDRWAGERECVRAGDADSVYTIIYGNSGSGAVYCVRGHKEEGTGTFEWIVSVSVNDNAPQFTSSSYAATISEDIPVGTSFLQVSLEAWKSPKAQTLSGLSHRRGHRHQRNRGLLPERVFLFPGHPTFSARPHLRNSTCQLEAGSRAVCSVSGRGLD